MPNTVDPATEREELLQFFDLCPVGIAQFAADGRIARINPHGSDLLGPFARGGRLENIFDVLADWLPALPGLVREFAAPTGTVVDQTQVVLGHGPRQRVVSTTVTRVAAAKYMAVFQDVTRTAAQERRIHADEQRLRAILDQVRDYAIYTLDLEGRITDWNHTLERLGGWSEADVVGKHVSLFFPPGEFDANAAGQVLTRAARRGSVEVEGKRVRKDGSVYWGDAIVTALPDAAGNVTGFVVVSRDMSERKLREDELLRLATTDPLTGAFNRRYGHDRLVDIFDRFQRYRTQASVLMIDIDHFKRVNDVHGHATGDAVLAALAALLRRLLRTVDAVVRWGGEEFLVLMPDTPAEAAAIVAGRILDAVRAKPFDAAGVEIPLTVSIGLATLEPEIASADALVKRADTALYAAKSAGRDRMVAA